MITAIWIMIPNIMFSMIFAQDSSSVPDELKRADALFAQGKYDSAKISYASAVVIFSARENMREYVDAQLGVSKCDLRLANLKNVVSIGLQLEKIHDDQRCRNCSHIGTIYSNLSYCYSHFEDFPRSVSYAEKSITYNIKTFGTDDQRTGSSYYALGIALKAKGDYPQAIAAMQNAILIQAQLWSGKNVKLANSLTMLGSLYENTNRFDSALVLFDRSLKILSDLELSMSPEAAINHIYAMTVLADQAEYARAIEHGKIALAIYDSLHMNSYANVASACQMLGDIYFATGDYSRTKEYLLHALEIFERNYPENRSAIGSYYLLLAEAYNRSEETEQAVHMAEKGMQLCESSLGEDHPQNGFKYEIMAGIYFDAGQYGKALSLYRKALGIRERVNDRHNRMDIVSLNSSIGKVYSALQNYDSARWYFDLACELDRGAIEKNNSISALLWRHRGELFIRMNRIDDALRNFDTALTILTGSVISQNTEELPHGLFHTTLDKKGLIENLEEIAGAYELRYRQGSSVTDLKRAQVFRLKAMDMIDDLRRQFSSDASKFFLAQHASTIYRNGCRVSVRLYELTGLRKYLVDAFLIADRSKGNVLLDRLADNKAKKYGAIPDSLIAAERRLLERITSLETHLSRSPASKKTAARSEYDSQMEFFKVSRQHQAMVEVFEKKYPEYYNSKYAKEILSVSAARRSMESGEVLVEYMNDDSIAYVFVLSKTSLTIKRLKDFSGINQDVRKFTSALKTFDPQGYWRSGTSLYSRLVKPILSEISGASRLTIVPDGILYSLPFEALPLSRPGTNNVDFSTVGYLINRFDISYTYSAAFRALHQEDELKRGSLTSFAGFAPVFKDSSKGSDLFANRSFAEQSGVSDVRSITLDGKRFNELKYSEDEVTSIGQRMRDHDISASTFLFSSATEHNFKMNAPSYDILHIATHGFINERDPRLSAVIFSQPDHEAADDDGVLYVNETVNLQLKARLVVLSSCESGVGQFVNGEGMIALSRGLLYAGAQNVIFSLWKVSDKQTYRLMDEFYRNLTEGKGYSSSLRSAKLSMIRSKETAFPGKWSGFVLIGR
ncbi:MAG: CHAT domain-containing protein [Bacteroidota bacterium]